MPELKINLPCVAEAALFPGLIGVGRTKRLVYLAETLDAKTALEWGLVERVAEDETGLDRAVEEWVDMLVGMGPTGGEDTEGVDETVGERGKYWGGDTGGGGCDCGEL